MFFCKQNTAYVMRISDWSSDVCSADLVELVIGREAATRLGIRMSDISAVLNNSVSQRQVSVMYGPLNQYHVVMGVDQRFAQDAESLKQVHVLTQDGQRVPLSAFAQFE